VTRGAHLPLRTVLKRLAGSTQIILAKFKLLGGDANRWQAKDVQAMTRAISWAEDRAELKSGPRAHREALRAVRRHLEDEG
jgi:hypothetical protein